MGVGAEETAVDIREVRQVAGLFRRVWFIQGGKHVADEIGGVGAILQRVRSHRVGELVLPKDAGVLGEVTKQQAGEKYVQSVPLFGVFHDAGVGGSELIEQCAHLLRGLDIRVGFGGVLGLFHAGPRQEEGEMLVNFAQREGTVLPSLQVVRDHFCVIGDNDKAGGKLHHRGRNAQAFKFFEQIAGGLAEVDDILLCDLVLWILSNVERAIVQARDISLGAAVCQQEIKDELAVIVILPGKGLDAFFDCLEVESCHLNRPSSIYATGKCISVV